MFFRHAGHPDRTSVALIDRPKRIVAASALYGATLNMLTNFFEPFGVETRFVDACDLDAVRSAVADVKPGCVLLETISNPLLRVHRSTGSRGSRAQPTPP